MPSESAAAPAIGYPHVDVLGVPVSAITMRQALEQIDAWVTARAHQYVCITGVHGVMESTRDGELRTIHERAGLVTPDGMPLVWLGRAAGYPVERVYGPDLMLEVCRTSIARGYRHFFYGGGPGVAGRLATRLGKRFQDLKIAGTYTPPFRPLTDAEDATVIETINRTEPDIVWVGLSTPRQERWMAAHVGRVSAPVLVGVGAAFDFHAGLKRQAPRWMQRSGLEWSFRLATEPRRLWRRYLRNNPAFAFRVAQQFVRTHFTSRAP